MVEIIAAKRIRQRCTGAISEVMSTSFGVIETFNKPTESMLTFSGTFDTFNKPTESFTIIN